MIHAMLWQRLRLLLLFFALLLLIICVQSCFDTQSAPDIPASPQLTVLHQGQYVDVELERFLVGVVAAEMPAAFEQQALCAQAVAARTYILSHCAPYGTPRHDKAAVCTDPACCQAWLDDDTLVRNWGEGYQRNMERVSAAVADTAGQLLTWQGAPITAAFCSTCGGSSEDSAACWSASLPYLIAQPCGYCSHSPRFCSFRALSVDAAAAALTLSVGELRALEALSFTPGGRVAELGAGAQRISGTQARAQLALDSAAFTWLIVGDTVIFASVGFGHGVGLCQYGADGMGRAGYDYQQILAHYYPHTQLVTNSE